MIRKAIPRVSSRLAPSLALLGLAFGVGGCEDLKKLDDNGSTQDGIPTEVQEIFDRSCNLAGCHDAGARAGGLDLTAAAAPEIIGGASVQSSLPLVELGNTNGSYLAVKLLADSDLRQGDRMPLGRDFNDPQVALDNAVLLGWIAGADLPGGDGGNDDDAPMTDDGTNDDGDSTAMEIVMCGLSDVAPTADNPFDIGDAAGQIPPDIGMALTDNCGCHGPSSDQFVEGAPPYGGQVNFSTIEEFNADSNGRPVHEVVLERVQSTEFSRMPPSYYCVLEDGEPITAADQQLLIDWLTAGAPDAPTWAGM